MKYGWVAKATIKFKKGKKIKDIWILTVKTSLPNTCYNSSDFTTTCEAYDSFEKGRDALRETIKKLAFSKNSMFDGKGNITYLNKYAEMYDDEVYDDDFEILDTNRINYVIDSLRDAFSGKDIEFQMQSEFCADGIIAIKSKPGEISFRGDDDRPYNGYDPDLRTNIFSMKEEKHYYLYIDDRFGQSGCTSELYIDLQKAELN